jgi:phage tail-like protein
VSGENETRASEFTLFIDEVSEDELHFMSVAGLELSMKLGEVDGAGANFGPRVVRDRRSPGKIQLSKGKGKWSQELRTWITDSLDPGKPLVRRSVTITVKGMDKKSSERTLTLGGAFPCAWSGPYLDTESDQSAIDQLAFAYESLVEGKIESEKSSSPSCPAFQLKGGGAQVTFASQPRSLEITHAGEYAFLAGPGMPRPRPDFHHGRPRCLKVSLVTDWDLGGDDLAKPESVYQQTDALQGFLKPLDGTREPPIVVFTYGTREFEGYVTNLDHTVEKFSSSGVPLRVSYQITMVEAFDAKPAEDSHVF